MMYEQEEWEERDGNSYIPTSSDRECIPKEL
jgi:hypothetical protein